MSKNVVTVSKSNKSIEAVLQNSLTFAAFFQRTKRALAANKMDRHSYNAHIADLLGQLNTALEKCNFIRFIREIWGTPPTKN